ncbi:MAG: protein kinase [Planctomycetes bacterium]|nr:protein kinase [Planctomycetota bacterium]
MARDDRGPEGAGPVRGDEPVLEAERLVEEIAESFLEALREGRTTSRRELVAAHPELAERLDRRLTFIEILHEAAKDVARHLRCPYCRSPFTVASPAPREAVCSSCGNPFRIEADEVTAEVPERLGRFQLLQVLGRGAFGVVYKALDPDLDRLVAVKVPRSGGFAGPGEEERFLREARSAARLRHPGIVQVHEVAEEGGLPYIVSECIEGRTLEAVIAEGRPGFREAAELVRWVALALGHAHREGVLHRDVKPGNILVDEAGRPHLADFGLARPEEGDVTVTLEGDVLGTPAYMSPEQAAGQRENVDARSDVYSLGVVLYELLTCERPFQGTRNMLIQQVLRDEPRPPRRINDHVPRDLETICLKAMAKEPARRYATAGELAEDLRRFLEREPIRARLVGPVGRLWRWCRRNPVIAALAAAVAALLLSAAAGATVAALRIERAREETSQALDRSREGLARLEVARGARLLEEGDLFGALPAFAEAMSLERGDPAREAVHRLRFGCVLARCPRLVQVFLHGGRIRHAELSRDERLVVTAGWDGRALVWDAAAARALSPPLLHGDAVSHASFSPDGRLLATASADRTARIWDWRRGLAAAPPLLHEDSVHRASFSPDGLRVLTASLDGTARLWSASTGEPVFPPLRHGSAVYRAELSPDGRLIVTASRDGTARIWSGATGEPVHTLRPGSIVHHAAFSPDGALVVTAGEEELALWDAATGERLWRVAGGRAPHAAFSPDGRLVAAAGGPAAAGVWRASTGERLGLPLDPNGYLFQVAFSPDGRSVLTSRADGTARLRDARTSEERTAPFRHSGTVRSVQLSSSGHRILTASDDGTARLWDWSRGPLPPLRHGGQLWEAAFSPDGRRLLTAGTDGTARVWHLETGAELFRLRHSGSVGSAAFGPAPSSRILTASADKTAALWSAEDGRRLHVLGLPSAGAIRVARFSPDGRLAAVGCADGSVLVWVSESGAPAFPTIQLDSLVTALDFSRDGRLLLTASLVSSRLCDVRTGEPVGLGVSYRSPAMAVAFSPDGALFATAGILWDPRTGAEVGRLAGHHLPVNRVAFSPDGSLALTASADGTAQVWVARRAEPAGPRIVGREALVAAAWSPDGKLVATGSSQGSVQVWDWARAEPVSPPLTEPARVEDLELSLDGRRLVAADREGTARVWDLRPDERSLEDLVRLAELFSGSRVDPPGGSVLLGLEGFREAWELLRSRYPEELTVGSGDVLQWHRREADSAEAAGERHVALWHLDRLIAAAPGRPENHGRRARLRAELGEWELAAQDLERLAALGVEHGRAAYEHALVALARGDREGYRRTCERLLERLGATKDPAVAATVAWTCALAPRALEDLGPAVELARRAAGAEASPERLRTLGAALQRAGRLEEAVSALALAAKESAPGGDALERLFLTLACRGLGRLEEARRCLERVPSMLPEPPARSEGSALAPPAARGIPWELRIEVHLLRSEAEAVLRGS